MIYSIYSIGKQGETAPPGSRKATFAAFSASAGGSQPSPCGLANLPLRRRSGPLEFWGNTGAFGKADDDAFLSVNFLTDLLAGPYLILSLNELAVFLHTPDPKKQNTAVPKTAADIADRLYKRMQQLNGVEIELPDDGIDESAADAGEEK